MARMMHLFRKYQYILLVVFGVLLMIVFVVGDALQGLSNPGPGGRTENVVLTWKNGRVTDNDLYNERARHRIALEYLQAIMQETTKRDGTPKGPGIFAAQDDRDLIRKLLLAEKARSLGLTVNNDAIYAFLYQLGDGELQKNDFAVLFKRTVGDRISQPQMMEQLEQEILAQQMLMMMRDGLFAIPPREAWEMHNRLRRRVATEMVALKVDDFKDQVPGKPSESQIQALYEEGKDRYPDPYSPQAGFKRRRRIAFEYVRSDFNKFQQAEIERIKPDITDADIEKYYADNKERYRDLDLPGDDAPALGTDGEASPTEEKSETGSDSPAGEDKKPAESQQDSPPAPSEEAKPAAEGDKPANPEPAKPADAPAEEPAESEAEKPEGEKPAEGEKPTEAPAEDSANDADESGCDDPQDEDESSSEQSPAETEAPAQPAAESPETPPATEPPTTEKQPAGDEPSPEPADKPSEPAATPATGEEATPATEKPEPAAAEGEAAAKKDEDAAATAPPEPKYKPLDDKLREQIRDEIAEDRARQPAQEKLTKALQTIESAIEKFGRQQRLRDAMPDAEKPEPVDYEALAAEHGMTAGKIDLVDPLSVEEYELGKSFQTVLTSWPPQRIPFAQIAYQDDWFVYRPRKIKGAELDIEFLYWKTAEEEAFVPELEDIRDEIVDAWKRREAFALARAEAERLAEEARGKKLAEVIAGREGLDVIEPGEFSWMTVGMTPFGGGGQPSLSAVDGVEGAGNDFMQAVFRLKEGETGVAANQAETAVYVVRIVSESPPESVRREQFLISGLTPEMQGIVSEELFELWDGWYNDLEKEFKVDWNN